jgi:transposase
MLPALIFILRSEKMEETKRRYVGIDLGKRTYEVAIVGSNLRFARGGVTLSNGKTTVEGRQALYRKLEAGDKVALEAGNLAFLMAKEIQAAVGCEVRVLNPAHLPLIYGTMKKTDKEDALKLAHILEDYKDERLPEAPVPSDQEMEMRKLLSSYRKEQGNRNRAISRKQAIVAIARRLAELLYTMVKNGTNYEVRHFKPVSEKCTGEDLAKLALAA